MAANPILVKASISGFVYGLGDWFAQGVETKGRLFQFDRKRLLCSSLAGFIGHGPLSHFYYIVLDELTIPLHLTGANNALFKVLIDQTIWSATWNSIYYFLIGVLRFDSMQTIRATVRTNFLPVIIAGWKLWPFAHCITYGLIPQEHRLLFVDAVEIVWVMLLSFYGNKKEDSVSAPLEPALAVVEPDLEIPKGEER